MASFLPGTDPRVMADVQGRLADSQRRLMGGFTPAGNAGRGGATGGKGGQLPKLGTGAGKGGQDPSSGLSGRLAGQVQDALGWAKEAEQSRRMAHQRTMSRLGEVDALFEGRDPFYQQVHDQALQSGTREADEWNRDATRQNRWDMLGRGLSGGSADVETQSLQRRRLGDVMGGVRAQARGAQRGARQGDLALRQQMRQGVLSGMPWQGAQAYKPFLSRLPDFQGANRRHWQSLMGGMQAGGLIQ